MTYEISSGNAPAECELAVTKLSEYLVKNYGAEIVNTSDGYNVGAYRTVTISTNEDLSEFVGSVLWVCKSPYRPNHKRKNWFINFKRLDSEEQADFDESKVVFSTLHSGGNGGQNVNKVETGVRIIHIPTGLVSQSTEERSQFQNKQRAMEKLREKLVDLQKEQGAKLVHAAWREHNRIVRGNPVRIYEGEKFVLRKR